MRRRLFLALVLLPLAIVAAEGCRQQDDGVVRREGEPDFVEAFDQKRMDAAIAEARTTLDTFVLALDAHAEGTNGFAVKKGFDYGDKGTEFIWLNEVRLSGEGFVGKVNNEPVNAVGVSLNQTVQVTRNDVADWMFMSQGRLRGGYTIVALVYGTPEQEEYAKSMGIEWTAYKFLEETK